ncbi:MAG TPA: exonuclease SbcCD subunit D [Candidatus Nanoarchaeia archaeon]|nr:exonuclease SbcCD subunit D [Candidatus Nanoarchaeia archaeon]
MKFAHMADCHIGGWKDFPMRELSIRAFERACRMVMEQGADFLLIAGDLFNTALPAIDKLKSVVAVLKRLQQAGIPVYIIPGSHDFSPSGKTMLDVLEEAELLTNVMKGEVQEGKVRLRFTTDPKTGAKMTGILGKRGMLEKRYYEALDAESLEREPGFKIFLFHTALSELKPKELTLMQAYPVSFLPKGFDYYAGGHVHIVRHADIEGYRNVVYPGPLFPNSFAEVEKLQGGGFSWYDDGKISYEHVRVVNVHSTTLDCGQKTPGAVQEMLMQLARKQAWNNTLVTIRLTGCLDGKVSDLDFREVFAELYRRGAYFVMKSASLLTSREFSEVRVAEQSVEAAEERLMAEHAGQVQAWEDEIGMMRQLLHELLLEKGEGEGKSDFEQRVVRAARQALGITAGAAGSAGDQARQ